jgi:hypothetical protein
MTNSLTYIITGLFTLLGVGFVIFLVKAISKNLAAGREYRRSLEEQAQAEPLGNMIEAMGLSSTDYLHGESVLNIRQQLHQCKTCPATDECEDWMEHPAEEAPPDFCPNAEHLRSTRDTLTSKD